MSLPEAMLRWTALAVLAGCSPALGKPPEICRGKFSIETPRGRAHVPLCSTRPIDIGSQHVTRIVIAINSLNYDANYALRNVAAAARKWPGAARKTMIVAPQLLKQGKFRDARDPKLLFWQVFPFWGSSRALTDSGRQKVRLSAFDVLDALLNSLTRPGLYKRLKHIIIVGHSAGGQFVNRYAASTTFEPPPQVAIKHVAMNPSTYLYFNDKRATSRKADQFKRPSDQTIKGCPQYNSYGHGLEKLYSYHRQRGLTPQKIREQYRRRPVVYAVGSKDTRRDKYLNKRCEAELQGRNRRRRAITYYNHLLDNFGKKIRETQSLIVVRRAKHSGRQMLRSKEISAHLFGK